MHNMADARNISNERIVRTYTIIIYTYYLVVSYTYPRDIIDMK